LLDTDGVLSGLVEATFERQVDTAAIGKGLFRVLFFTGKIVFCTLTILVAFLRGVVRATISSSAHRLIFNTHTTLAPVAELRWASIRDWTILDIDSAGAIVTSIEVLLALIQWSALLRRGNASSISARNQVAGVSFEAVILALSWELNNGGTERPSDGTHTVQAFVRGFFGAGVDRASLTFFDVDAVSIRALVLITHATHDIRALF
jgi:hypothetical protein